MVRRSNEFSAIKIFLVYTITFSIGYWISTLFIPFIKTDKLIVIYLLTGLTLELSAKISQMLLYNKSRMILDKRFLLWVIIHSGVVYGVVYLVQRINLTNQYLFILCVGLGMSIVTHIIWRFLYGKKGFKIPTSKQDTFALIKLPFALFTIFVLLATIYLTFTTFFIGLFLPPIISIGIAAIIIRFFDRNANGKEFLYDTLALAGVFLILFALLLYQMLAPIFELIK